MAADGVDPKVQLEAWNERAGIIEHAARMSRFTAEREACLELFGQENLPQEVAEAGAYEDVE